MRENGETPNFEDVIKQALKPKPVKFKVVLNATNPVYPMQPKNPIDEAGISINGFNTLKIEYDLKEFTNGYVTIEFLGDKAIQNGNTLTAPGTNRPLRVYQYGELIGNGHPNPYYFDLSSINFKIKDVIIRAPNDLLSDIHLAVELY